MSRSGTSWPPRSPRILDVDHQTIFQVSTVGALVEGVYEGAVRVGTLREHGDFGLGTFEGLDGEMVALDGEFFRVRTDGALHPVDDDVLSPYAMVTHFVARRRHDSAGVSDFDELCRPLDRLRDSENHFFAFRIDGIVPVDARARRVQGAGGDTTRRRDRAAEPSGTSRTCTAPSSGSGHRRTPRTSTCPATTSTSWTRSVIAAGTCSAARRRARRSATQRLEQLVVALPETADFLAADLRDDPSAALDVAERDHEPRGPPRLTSVSGRC